jgi:hypothetical protein
MVSLSAITNPSTNELGMNITNDSGGTVIINRIFAIWVKTPSSQKLDRMFLGNTSNVLWNTSDNFSPSDIPAEGNWISGSDRTILHDETRNFVLRFQDDLQPTGYEVHIVFDIGCQVVGTK